MIALSLHRSHWFGLRFALMSLYYGLSSQCCLFFYPEDWHSSLLETLISTVSRGLWIKCLLLPKTVIIAVFSVRRIPTRCESTRLVSPRQEPLSRSHCDVITWLETSLTLRLRQGHSSPIFINLNFCPCKLFLSYPYRSGPLEETWTHYQNVKITVSRDETPWSFAE